MNLKRFARGPFLYVTLGILLLLALSGGLRGDGEFKTTETSAVLAAIQDGDVRNTEKEGHHLKVFFATRHVSLRKALDQITRERVGQSIRGALTALRVFGTQSPRLAVAAVNPHGGENGAFGDEEIEHVGPACDEARAAGLEVVGPIPADSVFHQGLVGRYDGVLSQYHDQGHIAAKTYDFERTISVTVGLPFIRASVDHGTAFDIAGQGIASAIGMAESIRVTAKYALLVRPSPS